MNILQMIYYWIVVDYLFYFIQFPLLKQIKVVPDISEWQRAIESSQDDELQGFSQRLLEMADKKLIVPQDVRTQAEFYAALLYSFAALTLHSRRVLAPSKLLSDMLLHTRLPDVKTSQIKYIFSSFAIKLPEPVYIGSDSHPYSFVIAVIEDEAISLAVMQEDCFESITPKLYQELKIAFRDYTSRDDVVQKRATDFLNENIFGKRRRSRVFSFGIHPELTYSHCIDAEANKGWVKILSLVIGLNLYMQTSREEDTEVSVGESINDESVETVFRGAEVLELHIGKLRDSNTSDSSAETQVRSNIAAHFRKGHWRHTARNAKHPDGLIVWVRPALVCGKSKEEVHPVGLVQEL